MRCYKKCSTFLCFFDGNSAVIICNLFSRQKLCVFVSVVLFELTLPQATLPRLFWVCKIWSKVRPSLNQAAASDIFNMMIVPRLTYCSIINLNCTLTYKRLISSIEKRGDIIVNRNHVNKLKILSINHLIKKKACVIVYKCLNGQICTPLKNYFILNKHSASTRNQGLFLILPKVRLEFMKRSFFYSGARMFHELPKETRETSETKDFKKFLFFWCFMFICK